MASACRQEPRKPATRPVRGLTTATGSLSSVADATSGWVLEGVPNVDPLLTFARIRVKLPPQILEAINGIGREATPGTISGLRHLFVQSTPPSHRSLPAARTWKIA